MTLQALIFDFDGLILDTETPEALVWQSMYREHGFELPMDEWAKIIGGYGISNFNPAQRLAQLSGGTLNVDALHARYRSESDAAILASPILPGVEKLLDEAKRRAWKLAIASSSPHSWVNTHLARLGLIHQFDKIICADDVAPGRTKPNPDLFLSALDQLQVRKEAAAVFEDSLNGVNAAKNAGIFVVAVPNPLTARFGVDGANLTVNSLAELSVDDLMNALARHHA